MLFPEQRYQGIYLGMSESTSGTGTGSNEVDRKVYGIGCCVPSTVVNCCKDVDDNYIPIPEILYLTVCGCTGPDPDPPDDYLTYTGTGTPNLGCNHTYQLTWKADPSGSGWYSDFFCGTKHAFRLICTDTVPAHFELAVEGGVTGGLDLLSCDPFLAINFGLPGFCDCVCASIATAIITQGDVKVSLNQFSERIGFDAGRKVYTKGCCRLPPDEDTGTGCVDDPAQRYHSEYIGFDNGRKVYSLGCCKLPVLVPSRECTGTGSSGTGTTGTGTSGTGSPIFVTCCPDNPIPEVLYATLTGCGGCDGTYRLFGVDDTGWYSDVLCDDGKNLIRLFCTASDWFVSLDGALLAGSPTVSCSPFFGTMNIAGELFCGCTAGAGAMIIFTA